jgi:hypothetical protein
MSNTNTQEWGNIELPGLSDEELFKKNWQQSASQKQRFSKMSEEEKIEWSNKSKNLWKDLSFKNKMIEFYSSPEYIEYITNRNRELATRKDWIEKVEKLNKDKRLDEEHIKRHQTAIDKRTQDPDWKQKQAERSKPMVTPDGIFGSRKEAAEFYQVKTPVMNYYMKKYPTEYFYISQEEYIMLTGKDI